MCLQNTLGLPLQMSIQSRHCIHQACYPDSCHFHRFCHPGPATTILPQSKLPKEAKSKIHWLSNYSLLTFSFVVLNSVGRKKRNPISNRTKILHPTPLLTISLFHKYISSHPAFILISSKWNWCRSHLPLGIPLHHCWCHLWCHEGDVHQHCIPQTGQSPGSL